MSYAVISHKNLVNIKFGDQKFQDKKVCRSITGPFPYIKWAKFSVKMQKPTHPSADNSQQEESLSAISLSFKIIF